ncbi:cation:proton antiporter, partial [Streptococcus danieliae]|nr:cation:proton antiporter [Streptococcus danieliae]
GALVGIVTALLNRWVHNILMRFQAVDVAGELLLELGLPLLTFFLAEEFHVSGIIAVVVAGILKASRFRRINPLEAEVFETTEIVWKALTFMLNGSVFLLFGIEMVFLVDPILTSPVYDTVLLFGLCLVLTALLFGIRYVMLRIFYTLQVFFKKEKGEQDLLILTFAGVKGTVSIATILLLPQELKEEYPVLLFLVAGVTILSFLTGLLVLPNLAEPNREEADHLMEIAILTDVMKQLESELYQSQSKTSLYLVLDNYNDRLVNLTIAQEGKTIQEEWTDLMLLILSVENDGLEQAYEDDQISERAYFAYQRYLRAMERRINRSVVSKLTYVLLVVWRVLRLLLHEILTLGASSRQWMHHQNLRLTQDDEDDLAMLYLENTEVIVDALADLQGVYTDSLIQFVQDWRIRETAIIGDGGFVNRVLLREQAYRSKEMLKAYYLERKAIFDYENDGHISSQEANILRSQVNQLESFALKDATPSLRLVRMRRK